MSEGGLPHHHPFTYQPALDGVRALAVTMVLLFHAGFGWMSGGYVGVSVFFTLSGYLITSLLLGELYSTNRIGFAAFWGRRLRRLMPASVACLAAVAVMARIGWFATATSLRRDVLASLVQVANWNALLGHVSYADMVSRTLGHVGPVDHFWSLAIEEQFYWLWPIAFMALARGCSPRSVRWRLAALAVGGIAAAFFIAHTWGGDAAYWSTPARFGEVLLGAAAAGWLHGRAAASWWKWLAVCGLAAVVGCATTWPSIGGPAYGGWLPVFAVATVALIAGLQADGVVRRLLGSTPFVTIGRISYGLYLYHWPVFTVIDRRRLDVSLPVLTLVRVGVTLLVSLVSYYLLELPIRRGAWDRRKVFAVAGAGVVAMVVVVWIVLPGPTVIALDDTALVSNFGSTAQNTAAHRVDTTVRSGTAPTDQVGVTSFEHPERPRRVLLVGDSTMVGVAKGVVDWAAHRRNDVVVASVARVGCGVMRGSRMVGDGGGQFNFRCERLWREELPASLASGIPDTVAIMVTVPDSSVRIWSSGEGPVAPLDARFGSRLATDYESLYHQLRIAGVPHIVWIVPPVPSRKWIGWGSESVRLANWRPMVDEILNLGRREPGVVDVVRLDEWLASHEPRDDGWRYDGLHFDAASATTIATQFLGPLLLQGPWHTP